MVLKNPVAREAGDTAPVETQPSLTSLRKAAPLATGPLLCWYDDGRPAAAFIEVTGWKVAWCAKHLSTVSDWPARAMKDGWFE